ncbi:MULTISPECIES: glycosyl hydrolase family 17 protein [Nonlabens]|uniref:glycosyl hydrolase family 17 protein n=1 Tax=Nonlabens TaxID=363408 RepID=UPI000D4F8102|nr:MULTISPECIES: glycosyl hydrolase family 17 protein [Nonlabens]PQJ17220.1 glycosyl hydrolase family 17 [Nonlabens tegetincola]
MRIPLTLFLLLLLLNSCKKEVVEPSLKTYKNMTAQELLSQSNYQAMCYGGYREMTRDKQPTIDQIKEDLRILNAMDVRLIRTYNVQLPHATNVLKAIRQLKAENPDFEMYVMLGAWIDCKNAWTGKPVNHDIESEQNEDEIGRAVALAQEYPDIIKIIAVGNEAMVKWATSYYVQPDIILKWVKHLQDLKKQGQLPTNLWITSSDNFASWGGGDTQYHVPALNELIREVDFISIHTYPMHDTHYNPVFWGVQENEARLSKEKQIEIVMQQSLQYAINQYESVVNYVQSIGEDKPVYIGETGWASFSNELYGKTGSKAVDEYKAGIYYKLIREWSIKNQVTCFYFEAFDEKWKDAENPQGSENHFGLFSVNGQAKYALWDLVDQDLYKNLSRDGNPINKTFNGDEIALLKSVSTPPIKRGQ